ncbi:hypothetical protein P154DRAFT_219721 [Amniculicola lignicola CBS 123094]|uniref:Uncharacterized protein n=1 Tax=Amniculicola lignicola CBS 123094 TaxID=1392246 RepID=A0A6A5X0B5_9PLEO|nr:hypothetical protein P154DRAFT_219721 [Amniculicola lignicola CBS 123094]
MRTYPPALHLHSHHHCNSRPPSPPQRPSQLPSAHTPPSPSPDLQTLSQTYTVLYTHPDSPVPPNINPLHATHPNHAININPQLPPINPPAAQMRPQKPKPHTMARNSTHTVAHNTSSTYLPTQSTVPRAQPPPTP